MKATTPHAGASALDEGLLRRYRFADPIYVTRPTMPKPEDYLRKLERPWRSGWLTNDGALHRELRVALCDYLDVEHLSLCCNGTVALLIALQALRITSGEVITTPFTFPATVHALYWNRVRPVFCDIDEDTFNLDPDRIEELIGPDTRAILPVHVFGRPCDVEGIQFIAEKHGLNVIYDAAHLMGVRAPQSPLAFGDLSVLSFHATKLFTTIEGGAIVSSSSAQQERIDFLKNFGIADAETVIGPGINGKMNEFQAAFGLLQLEGLELEIENRARVAGIYRKGLRDVPGLGLQPEIPQVRSNHAYFPVLVDPSAYGMDRDRLHSLLARFNVHARKYFHPLCNHYPCYSALPSAGRDHVPVAERIAERILCLPIYGTLAREAAERICLILAELHRRA